MPKGVEHHPDVSKLLLDWSVESLMPKGVEHILLLQIKQWRYCVESLMPKGVEHLLMTYRLLSVYKVSNL